MKMHQRIELLRCNERDFGAAEISTALKPLCTIEAQWNLIVELPAVTQGSFRTAKIARGLKQILLSLFHAFHQPSGGLGVGQACQQPVRIAQGHACWHEEL